MDSWARYSAVLFDLDGTLLDTSQDICDALNAALAAQGLSGYTPAQTVRMVGSGVRALISRAAAGRQCDLGRLREDYMREYASRLIAKTRPYEGMQKLADRLKARGYRLGVFSNKPDRDTARLIRELFKEGTFDAVAGQVDGVPVKPHPAGLLALLEKLGVSPRDAVLVGDSDVDAMTAKNAGTGFIGVTWGYRTEDEMRAAGGKVFAASPEQIAEMV
jgi:phosphoglycolate phosphatase